MGHGHHNEEESNESLVSKMFDPSIGGGAIVYVIGMLIVITLVLLEIM
jgi:hypothetical protein